MGRNSNIEVETDTHFTNNRVLKNEINEKREDMTKETQENVSVAKLNINEKLQTPTSNLANVIAKIKNLKCIFTTKFVLTTGLFFISAIFFGCSVSTKLDIERNVQDSIQITSYAANCHFYPFNPFMYANFL